MAAHFIEVGKHFDNQLLSSWPHLGQRVFSKQVEFHQDCAYDIGPYNQTDVNKLFGASFGLRGAHWNSARFGWYYDPADQKMVLLAYVYDRGKRNQDSQLNYPEVARIRLGETVDCSIRITATDYVFHVTRGDLTIGKIVAVSHSRLPCWGITLGLYWGGETLCPHTMHIFFDDI